MNARRENGPSTQSLPCDFHSSKIRTTVQILRLTEFSIALTFMDFYRRFQVQQLDGNSNSYA